MVAPIFKSLTVKFTPELVAELTSYSAANGVKLSESVRRAVVSMLAAHKVALVESALASVSVPDLIVGFDAALAACDAAPFQARAGMLQLILEDLRRYKPAFQAAAKDDLTLAGELRRLALTLNNKLMAKVSKDEIKAELRSREPARPESMASYNLDDPLDTSHLATPEELAHFNLPASFNDTYGSPYTTQEDFQIRSDISWLRGHLGGRSVHPPVGESELGTAHLLWSIEFYEAVSPDSDRLAQLKEFRDTGTYTQS